MNHDGELRMLGLALKVVLAKFDADIGKITDARHLSEVKQGFDKAQHFMLKMSQAFDDLNAWLTAFGPKGDEKQ